MPTHSRKKCSTLQRKYRRWTKAKERRKKLKEIISKQRFLKLTTIFMFILVTGFTAAIIAVFLITKGSEPSALVEGFFEFVKWEFAGLSVIKISENIGTPQIGKPKKLKKTINDGAELLDDTANLIRDVTDLSSPTSILDDSEVVETNDTLNE